MTEAAFHKQEHRQQFRVGLIGAGHICEFHIRGLRRLPNIEIIGICDLDAARAQDVARRHQLPAVFTSLDELLATKPDAVHVLTPPESHASITLAALANGCHVFVEKPLATCVTDCRKIAEAAEAAGKTVSVDHSLLRDPFVTKVRKIVESGKIGDVIAVDCLRSQEYPPYEKGPLPPHYRAGGFPFRDLGIHSLYLIESFLGPVCDADWRFEHRGHDPLLFYDEWRMSVRCQRGTGSLYISWNVRPLQDLLVIQGTRGVIRLDLFGMSVSMKWETRLPQHPQRVFNAMKEGWSPLWQVPLNMAKFLAKRIRRYHGLQEMVAEFYQRIEQGHSPVVSASSAGRTLEFVERAAADADSAKQAALSRFTTSPQAPILVTGATGFIGGRLLAKLLAEGKRVRILTRREPAEHRDHPNLEMVFGDLGDPGAVDQAVKGAALIYHVGGVVHGHPHEFRRGSVEGTRNIVNSALEHEVDKIVYVSSLSVLHSSAGKHGETIDESWLLEPRAENRGIYTQTKLAAERIVDEAVKERGLPAVILRPAEVIGHGAPLLSPGVALQAAGRLVIFGRGETVVPMVHVEDVVEGILAAAEKEISFGTVLHLVDSTSLSQNEILARYQSGTGDRRRVFRAPMSLVYCGAFGIQALCWLLRRDPPLSVYRVKSATANRTFSGNAAERILNWKPQRNVSQALDETLAAHRKVDESPLPQPVTK
ncbi:MAG: NAD-dependent epimerase/dehydratase family protein [Pirellulales bacterium]|nr:NAD-dependent epimerase/dehydratase family protein [Pirellulales bacterium]